jgi:hypothetical protein
MPMGIVPLQGKSSAQTFTPMLIEALRPSTPLSPIKTARNFLAAPCSQ